jgi:HEAT repeat protein
MESKDQRKRLRLLSGGGVALLLLIWLINWRITRPDPADTVSVHPQAARIAQLQKEKNIPALGQALKDKDPEVARMAVSALAAVSGPAELRPALVDARPEVRETAFVEYGRLGDRDHVDVINSALTADTSPAVRAAAARSLAELHSWNGLDALLRAVRDPDVFVRRCAMESIQSILSVHYAFNPEASDAELADLVGHIRRELPALRGAYEISLRKLNQTGSRR